METIEWAEHTLAIGTDHSLSSHGQPVAVYDGAEIAGPGAAGYVDSDKDTADALVRTSAGVIDSRETIEGVCLINGTPRGAVEGAEVVYWHRADGRRYMTVAATVGLGDGVKAWTILLD